MKKEINPLTKIFGQKLAELRKSQQMSQYEFAEKIGMSRSMISYYESWAKNPTLETLHKISTFFNISAFELINSEDNENKIGSISKLQQQVDKVKKLSPHKQRMISGIIEVALNTK